MNKNLLLLFDSHSILKEMQIKVLSIKHYPQSMADILFPDQTA